MDSGVLQVFDRKFLSTNTDNFRLGLSLLPKTSSVEIF